MSMKYTTKASVNRVNEECEKHGLNAGKTEVMKVLRQAADNEDNQHIRINGTEIENDTQFTYLGAKFTDIYDVTPEIKRRIAIAKQATISLTNIWKDWLIALRTKRRLLSSLMCSIAGYGAECWTMKESDEKRLESFELWCYRRLLRVSLSSRTTNLSHSLKLVYWILSIVES